MAKLKAPLLSLGASGQLGNALVFFDWKGLDVAREYVIPTNPKSAKQTIQRNYLTAAVLAIHTAEALAADPLDAADKVAEALLGSCEPTPRTWFNTIGKKWLDQRVAALRCVIYRNGTTTPTTGQIAVTMKTTPDGANAVTAGDIWYGLTKTSMPNKVAATVVAGDISGTITGLTNKVKYFIQFRPTAHADFVGCNSGIYTDIPHA